MKTPIYTKWDDYHEEWQLLDADNNYIGGIQTASGQFDKEAERDASEFVRRVNAFDGLSAIARLVVSGWDEPLDQGLAEAERMARDVLAKLEDE